MYIDTTNGLTKDMKYTVFSITCGTENNTGKCIPGTLSELKGNGIEKENERKSLLRYAKT